MQYAVGFAGAVDAVSTVNAKVRKGSFAQGRLLRFPESQSGNHGRGIPRYVLQDSMSVCSPCEDSGGLYYLYRTAGLCRILWSEQ